MDGLLEVPPSASYPSGERLAGDFPLETVLVKQHPTTSAQNEHLLAASPIPGFLDSWIPRFLDSWVPGFLDPWIPGFLDPWIPGLLGSWLPGLLGSWIPGSLRKAYLGGPLGDLWKISKGSLGISRSLWRPLGNLCMYVFMYVCMYV